MERTAAARPAAPGLLALCLALAAGAGIAVSVPEPAPPVPAVGSATGGSAEVAEDRTGPGEDGSLPDGTTVFDERYPGVANVDPDLRDALRRASADAAEDGVALSVNSGWRSRHHQDRLLAEAVARYGPREAARWVATADTSAHVSGDAVDVGPPGAAAWLAEHGGRYGLCRIYRNEPWHFELRPRAVGEGCPPEYADPTRDPRMRR